MAFTTETVPGVEASPDAETKDYVLNHTMLRIKDPQRSLDFYTRILGMRLVRKLDFPAMQFSLYFLGDAHTHAQPPEDTDSRTEYTFGRPALLELTHNWGAENDPAVAFHDGNSEPKGFGHIAMAVPDIYKACTRLEGLGVTFVKKPDDGKMKGIAFIKDPDGYWIELVQPNLLPDLVAQQQAS